ncbi:MAG: hypothetical protein ACLBM4_10670, partial [Dolichospermum sp.]
FYGVDKELGICYPYLDKEELSTQDLRKISLKSSFLRDLCAWSGSLFHESCVSPTTIKLGFVPQPNLGLSWVSFLNPTYDIN